MKFGERFRWLPALLLIGCAGVQRDCSSCLASNTGADWLIVQYRFDGKPINCWKLSNIGVTNEGGSDGIFWRNESGHLIHISGWYNRVQVQGGRYGEAAGDLGIRLDQCVGGAYLPDEAKRR